MGGGGHTEWCVPGREGLGPYQKKKHLKGEMNETIAATTKAIGGLNNQQQSMDNVVLR